MRSKDPAGIGWGRRKKRGLYAGRRFPFGPVATVCGICILVFVIQYVGSLGWVEETGEQRSLNLAAGMAEEWPEKYPLGATGKWLLAGKGEVWTLLTYIFVHGDHYHILFNLILIWFVGRILVHLIGNKHFVGIFLLSGIGGGLLQIITSGYDIPLVGASAGGFGILIATAAIIPNQVFNVLLFFFIPIRCRIKYLALGFVYVEIVFFIIDRWLEHYNASIPEGDLREKVYIPMVSGFAHGAHLGGAIVGWIYVRIFGIGGSRLSESLLRKRRDKADRGVSGRNFKNKGKIISADVVTEVEGFTIETDEFTMVRINPLLEKISEQGMSSLTQEEREVLEKYSKEVSGRDGD